MLRGGRRTYQNQEAAPDEDHGAKDGDQEVGRRRCRPPDPEERPRDQGTPEQGRQHSPFQRSRFVRAARGATTTRRRRRRTSNEDFDGRSGSRSQQCPGDGGGKGKAGLRDGELVRQRQDDGDGDEELEDEGEDEPHEKGEADDDGLGDGHFDRVDDGELGHLADGDTAGGFGQLDGLAGASGATAEDLSTVGLGHGDAEE